MPEPLTVRFAWCFSHGVMHRFDPADPWCTASWVWLASRDEADAVADKQWRYGDARFLHDLSADQQFAIIDQEQHHA